MLKYWADKWVDALESGEYKQGSGNLRRHTPASTGCAIEGCCDRAEEKITYCCLGVLTDVVLKDMPNIGKWTSSGFIASASTSDWSTNDYTPFVIQQITGLGSHNPTLYVDENRKTEFGVSSRKVSAATANDEEYKNFSQIAAYIRENYATM